MKKILILTLVAVATLWAEVKVEMAIRIENLPEEVFDFDSWDGDPDVCLNLGCWDSRGVVCPTDLDSSILYGWVYVGNVMEFYILTDATHSWRESFEDELNRYRKCWKGVADDSAYNSIFEKIDSVLVPEINNRLQNKDALYTNPLVYDHFSGAMLGIRTGPSMFDLGEYAEKIVKARNAAISSIAPAKYKLETIRVQNHRLTASPKLLGREFTLFDVNGHELRCGTLQNNMQLPAYPTVIKIQGFGTRLLNSR